MLQLNKLISFTKKRKRVGRGGSRGGTSGRGHKGQLARSGSSGELKPFFEGGQMPLSRRLPRRGFFNRFKLNWKTVSLRDLEAKFDSSEDVSIDLLRKKGLVKGKKKLLIKILGNGQLTKSLTVHAHAFSKSAISAIENVGGKAEFIKENGRGNTAT